MMCVQRLAQSLPSFCTIKRHLWLYNQKFLKQYFFPMLVQKHGTLDPKIQISINFALSLPTFCTMITSSKGYIQKVRLFDLNLISLLWCNQMLVNLSQKSESYIFFIHSVMSIKINHVWKSCSGKSSLFEKSLRKSFNFL